VMNRINPLPRLLGRLTALAIGIEGGAVLRAIGARGVAAIVLASTASVSATPAAELLAGVAKVDITDRDAGPVNDPLYAKALVLSTGETTTVLVSIDAVAIGEIGRITHEFLPSLRARVASELAIPPLHVVVNASHCHGIVRQDIQELTFQAIRAAQASRVPVRCGVGVGIEDRIQENRRLGLKSGRTIDVRHAYALPPDDEVVSVGLIDPQVGVMRLDRLDGQPLAVVYNFACHPIQGVPGGANTADIIGYASQVIEENLGEGVMALFLQGAGGDINPITYKAVDAPRSAQPLGHMLGLSTLKAAREIQCKDDSRLKVLSATLTLPRFDASEKIFAMETEQRNLLQSLRGTSLNLKTFLPLTVKYSLSDPFPSANSHQYLHEASLGREHLRALDAENRRNMNAYIQNIHVMEELTRLQTNLALLRKHHASLIQSGKRTIDLEIVAVRVGEFVLTGFPGELTVEMGLGIKQRSPHEATFVAGYTNGYIYYCPTAQQMQNRGNAQEDSDCILDPQWQKIYDQKVDEMLDNI